jgi:hypothetical protein
MFSQRMVNEHSRSQRGYRLARSRAMPQGTSTWLPALGGLTGCLFILRRPDIPNLFIAAAGAFVGH